MLAITGHTFHDLIGTHYQQDVDLGQAVHGRRGLQPARNGSGACSQRNGRGDQDVALGAPYRISPYRKIFRTGKETDHQSSANISKHSGDFRARISRYLRKLLQEAADYQRRFDKVAMLVGRGCRSARKEVLQVADWPALRNQGAARKGGHSGPAPYTRWAVWACWAPRLPKTLFRSAICS